MLRLPCARNFSATCGKKSRKASQVFGMSDGFVAGLVEQRLPDMERGHRHAVRDHVIAALFRDVVVGVAGLQRRRHEQRFLRLDDVGEVDQLVLPGAQHAKEVVAEIDDVGHDAARHRGDLLLPHRGKRHDAVVDLVAARLLVIGDHLLEGDILFLGEALHPPHRRGRRRGVGDIGAGQSRTRRGEPSDPRSTDRLVRLIICSSFLFVPRASHRGD